VGGRNAQTKEGFEQSHERYDNDERKLKGRQQKVARYVHARAVIVIFLILHSAWHGDSVHD
jgi:Na+/H+ antiporter NhaB